MVLRQQRVLGPEARSSARAANALDC